MQGGCACRRLGRTIGWGRTWGSDSSDVVTLTLVLSSPQHVPTVPLPAPVPGSSEAAGSPDSGTRLPRPSAGVFPVLPGEPAWSFVLGLQPQDVCMQIQFLSPRSPPPPSPRLLKGGTWAGGAHSVCPAVSWDLCLKDPLSVAVAAFPRLRPPGQLPPVQNQVPWHLGSGQPSGWVSPIPAEAPLCPHFRDPESVPGGSL